MKNLISVISGALFLLASLTGCQPSKDKDGTSGTMDSTSNHMTSVEYTCSMHPDVITDQPGQCPKCGMDLVKKDDAHDHMDRDSAGHDH